MVKNILSEMDSDDVTSYTDTVESQQVAEIIRNTYDQIISGKDWPNLYSLFRLTNPTSTFQPTRMAFPETMMDVKWVKYNVSTDTRDRFQIIEFVEPYEFMRRVEQRDSLAANVQDVLTLDGSALINVYTDRAPSFWTSFSESAATFDAFNSNWEDFGRLASPNSQGYGKLAPNITMSDTLEFPLPLEAYSYLLEEAKSVCFLTLKQMPNPKAEQHSNTQRRRMSQKAWAIRNGITYPSYGRVGRK